MASVTLTHVVKTFRNVIAVDDLSIEVRDREFAVFVGPSGCGKTTALRMIAGLEPVTSGEIRIGDRVVNDVDPKDRDIAMVFQNYALYPHMNVRENLGFGLKMRKFPKAEIEGRVEEAADILGIQALLERKPRELSGGQRQRVALGRAIVRKPAVFLFDEPLSNLDAKLRVAMRAEISKLHKRLGATIVYVTHDQVEAMTMADRIFVMNKGSLQQSGDPLDLYKNPANRFVAAFIGSPAMNFLEATLVRDGQTFHLEAEQLRLRLPGRFAERLAPHASKSVVFGVRPEDMFLPPGDDQCDMDCLTARAEVVEKLGAEVFLHLALGPHALVARMETPDRHLAAGQDVTLRIRMAKTHVFDAESSETIV